MKPATLAVAAVCGAIFGFGLALSTMAKPEVVLDFLLWRDAGLLLVMGGAVAVTALAYFVLPRLLRKPALEPAFAPYRVTWQPRVVAGAAIFGAGWGLCGVCPGPAIASLGLGNWPTLFALAGMLLGGYLHGRYFAPRARAA